jgi:hypothetical protein
MAFVTLRVKWRRERETKPVMHKVEARKRRRLLSPVAKRLVAYGHSLRTAMVLRSVVPGCLVLALHRQLIEHEGGTDTDRAVRPLVGLSRSGPPRPARVRPGGRVTVDRPCRS